ncbi:Transporter [uncultured Gammaproteobacteria bacterium]
MSGNRLRPANILYGLEDRPPLPILLLSTAQQTAAIAAISFATLITVLDAAQVDLATASNALRVAMLALGVVTVLQCAQLGRIGTGYLVPAVFATSYLPGMLLAAREGGLPLVFGMTILAGFTQAALAKTLPRLRAFFPTEIAGFVVFMIGLGMGTVGIRQLLGVSLAAGTGAASARLEPTLLGSATLAVMVVISIWSKGKLRTFCVLVGIVVGYLLALAMNLLDPVALAALPQTVPFKFPVLFAFMPTFSLKPELVLPFLVGAIACSLRTIGDVTTAQKLNDAKWLRPDLISIEGGLFATGLGNVVSGLIGSIGSNTASSGVGLSGATGVTSRRVGYAMGVLLTVLSCLPPMAVLLTAMPRPVLGAVLMFTGCLVIMNGLQMVLSRLIDGRKTLVIGLSLILAISDDMFPNLFDSAPYWLQPFVDSSVVLSILSALTLNFLFRIGVRQKVAIPFHPGQDTAQEMFEFMQRMGGAWGARQDVIHRATRALSEFAEIAPVLITPETKATIAASFDEFHLQLELSYTGQRFETVNTAPTGEELLDDESALTRLACLLITRAADRISIKNDGDVCHVFMHFDH